MNRKICHVVAVVCSFLFFAALAPTLSYAQRNSVTILRRDGDVTVIQANGSMNFKETWVVRFDGGPFQYAFRCIAQNKITDVSDWGVSENGHEYVRLSSQAPNTFYTYNEDGQVCIKWYFSNTTNQTRTFNLAYTVYGGLQIYSGGDQFYWHFIESNRQYAINSSTVTLHLPGKFTTGQLIATAYKNSAENSQAARIVDGNTVVFIGTDFAEGDEWELRAQFPHGVVNATVQSTVASPTAVLATIAALSQAPTPTTAISTLATSTPQTSSNPFPFEPSFIPIVVGVTAVLLVGIAVFFVFHSVSGNRRAGGIDISGGSVAPRDIVGGNHITYNYPSEKSPAAANQNALSGYLREIHEYLKDPNFRMTNEGIQIRALARASTLSALRVLDSDGKTALIRFLLDSQLLLRAQQIISLDGADASGVDLRSLDLTGLNLNGLNLTHARLVNSNLSDTKLKGVVLENADLTGSTTTAEQLAQVSSLNGTIMPDGIKWQGNPVGPYAISKIAPHIVA